VPGELWKRAKKDLHIEVGRAPPDPIIWEHVTRVARLVEAISCLPEVSTDQVEGEALQAAALYHDAGWIVQVRSGQLMPHEVFSRPASDLLRELGADWATERLADLVPAGMLSSIARIIRECNNRRSKLLEARILTEADNLDEIGPQAICLMIRKQRAEGKTLNDLIKNWERQEEYNFWEARIKDCFRIPSVRKRAEHRLQMLRRFMADLKKTVLFEDLNILNGVAAS